MSDSNEEYWGFGRTCGCAFGIGLALAVLIFGGLSELMPGRGWLGRETNVFCCGTVLYSPIYCLVSSRYVIRLSGVLASALWGSFWAIGMITGGFIANVVFLERCRPELNDVLNLAPVFLGIALAHGVVAMFVYGYRKSGLPKGRAGLICMNCGYDLRGLTEPRAPSAASEYKMLRKTLTILSLIGLLLSVGLWGVSYWNLEYSGSGLLTEGWLSKGGISCYIVFSPRTSGNYWEVVGFGGLDTEWWPQSTQSGAHWFVHIPLWMPTLLFGSILYFCRPLHYHRRRKRKKLGLCVKCGYDLRGSKGRCPECGQDF